MCFNLELSQNVSAKVNDEQCLEFWFSKPIKPIVKLSQDSIIFYNSDNQPIVIKLTSKIQMEYLRSQYATTVFGYSIAMVYLGEFYKNYFKEN